MQLGWYAVACDWIESTLQAMEYTLTSPIEQFDSWDREFKVFVDDQPQWR